MMIPPRQLHQCGLFAARDLECSQQDTGEMFRRAQLVGFDFANRDFGAARALRQFFLRQVVRAATQA
jgi:hypothetical protein